MKILVLRGGALGDFIVTIPALRLLKSCSPDAEITLVGNATAARLGVEDGVLKEAYSQNEARWASLYGTEPLHPEFREWLGTFSLVVCYWPDPSGELSHRFPIHASQQFLQGSPLPSQGPAAAHYCSVLHSLQKGPGKIQDFRPHLRLPRLPPAPQFPQVSIHPGSGSPLKNWPLDRWLTIARALSSQGHHLLIVAGECDREAAPHLAPFGELLLDAPLSHLAYRLAQSKLHIGHDTGVSHLAASLDISTIILFGPTDPAIWAPPGPHVTVLHRGPTPSAISEQDLLRALSPYLKGPGEIPKKGL